MIGLVHRLLESICQVNQHIEIIRALYNIGVKDHYLNYFLVLFFKIKSFTVKALNAFSDEKEIQYVAPQGSQLGLVIFIVYLSEIILNMKNYQLWAFADNVLIFSSDKEIKVAEDKMKRFHNIRKMGFYGLDV